MSEDFYIGMFVGIVAANLFHFFGSLIDMKGHDDD